MYICPIPVRFLLTESLANRLPFKRDKSSILKPSQSGHGFQLLFPGTCALPTPLQGTYKPLDSTLSGSPSLVLGHVLSPVRFLPRHSLLLIANYTSEPVCCASAFSNFWKLLRRWLSFCSCVRFGDGVPYSCTSENYAKA